MGCPLEEFSGHPAVSSRVGPEVAGRIGFVSALFKNECAQDWETFIDCIETYLERFRMELRPGCTAEIEANLQQVLLQDLETLSADVEGKSTTCADAIKMLLDIETTAKLMDAEVCRPLLERMCVLRTAFQSQERRSTLEDSIASLGEQPKPETIKTLGNDIGEQANLDPTIHTLLQGRIPELLAWLSKNMDGECNLQSVSRILKAAKMEAARP